MYSKCTVNEQLINSWIDLHMALPRWTIRKNCPAFTGYEVTYNRTARGVTGFIFPSFETKKNLTDVFGSVSLTLTKTYENHGSYEN